MKRQEFEDMINYIKNRPEAARRLREALALAETPKEDLWVPASKAARMVGKSCRWIRAHIDLFPSAKQVERGNEQFTWMIKESEVITQYNVWAFNH